MSSKSQSTGHWTSHSSRSAFVPPVFAVDYHLHYKDKQKKARMKKLIEAIAEADRFLSTGETSAAWNADTFVERGRTSIPTNASYTS
jgi:hypothetical protein